MRKTLRDLLRGDCNACFLFIIIALISAAYWLIEPRVNPILMNDFVDGPLMVTSFVAAAQYFTWTLFNCHRIIDRVFVLRCGICMGWLGNGIWRVSRLLYAQGIVHGTVGEHDPWRGFMIVLMTMAATMHIIAIDMEKSRPQRSSVLLALASVGLGFGGMVVLHWQAL